MPFILRIAKIIGKRDMNVNHNRRFIEGNDLDIIIDQMGHVYNLSCFGSREDLEHILWHLPEIPDNKKSFNLQYLADYQMEKLNLFWEVKGKTLEFFGFFDEAFEHYKTNLTSFIKKRAVDGSVIEREVDYYNYVSNSKARMFLHTNKIEKAMQYFDTAINEDEYIGEGVSHYEKAYGLVQLGRLDESLRLIGIIEDKELLADTPRVLYLKHIIMMKQKKYKNAIECLDKIIEDFKPADMCNGCRDFLKFDLLKPRITHVIFDHNSLRSEIDFYETVLISKIKTLREQNRNDEAMALVDNLLINYEKDSKKYVIRKDNNNFYHQLLRYKQIPIKSNQKQDTSLLPIISYSYHHTRFNSKFPKSDVGVTYKQALNLIRDKYSNCRFTIHD